MKTVSLFFALLLTALCGCEQQSITRQEPKFATDPVVANFAPATLGNIINAGPYLPSPEIIKQTYIPPNDFFAHTRCRTWRITWPTYPAGTSSNLIPTMFSLTNGMPYSFTFLNNTLPANTYKTNFSLYYDNNLETVSGLWDELIHTHNVGQNIETTWFKKTSYSATTIESWVKERPNLFKVKWEDTEGTIPFNTKMEDYKQGDIYLFKLVNQQRYGGIRIVSMTPRIIEVYLAEPNN